MRKFLLIVVLAFILSPDMSFSETQFTKAELLQRFKLFAECKPMDIVVDLKINHRKNFPKLHLTEQAIQYVVESRLRATRLFRSELGIPYLYINVHTWGEAFNISMKFQKRVQDNFPACTALPLHGTPGA